MRGTNVNIEILWSVAKGPHLSASSRLGDEEKKLFIRQAD
jgi:hypothetical protein